MLWLNENTIAMVSELFGCEVVMYAADNGNIWQDWNPVHPTIISNSIINI